MTPADFLTFFRRLSGENTITDADLTVLIAQAQDKLDSLVAEQYCISDDTKTLTVNTHTVAISNAKRIDGVRLVDSSGKISGLFKPGEFPYQTSDGQDYYRYPTIQGVPTACRVEFLTSTRAKNLEFNTLADQTYTVLLYGEFKPAPFSVGDTSNWWTAGYPMVLYTATSWMLAVYYSNAERVAELTNVLRMQIKEIGDLTSQAEDPGNVSMGG